MSKEIDMEVVKVKSEDQIVARHVEKLDREEHNRYYPATQKKPASLRRKLVFELHKAALPYEEIADKVKQAYSDDPNLNRKHIPNSYNKKSVSKDISKYLEQYQEEVVGSAREMILVEVERINEMINALWDRVRNVDGPAELKAIDRIVKLQREKIDFLGIDSSDKIEVTDRTGKGFAFGWADPNEAPKFKSNGNSDNKEVEQDDN